MISQAEFDLLNHFKSSGSTGLTVQEVKNNKLETVNELNTLLARRLIEPIEQDKPITCASVLVINQNGLDVIILYQQNKRKLLSKIKQWIGRKL